MEGFDNGQSQYFVAEVIDQDTDMLVTNMTSSKLSFKIGRLSPGKSLRMNVYAVNTRGRSEAVVFETFTLESAQKHTGECLFILISIRCHIKIHKSFTQISKVEWGNTDTG